MTDVMISYSRRDGDFVRRLYAGLKERNREVWVDWQDIPLSADWWLEIANAIEAADTFVFVVSPDSMGSPICNLEIAHARNNNKRLIPILYRRTDIEDALDRLDERELSENTLSVLEGRTIEEVARKNWNAVSRHNWLYFEDMSHFDENIERLISVLETDLAHVKEHTRLLVRAAEWDRRDHGNAFLLSGEAVREAEEWLTHGMDKEPAPTALHADYIAASRRMLERRQRRLLIGVSAALVIAVILTVVAGVLAFVAAEQAERARVARADAEFQAEIAATNAAEANSLLWASYADQTIGLGDSPLALSLALASVDIAQPPALAQSTLARVAYAPGPIARYVAPTENETVEVTDVRFNPGGTGAAIALSDRRLQLYDLAQEDVTTTLTDFQASVTSVQYTPNGEAVLASSFNQVLLFDTATGEVLQSFEHPLGSIVNAVAVSPDGTRAASGANNNQIILWNLNTDEAEFELMGHTDEINSLAFSEDGTQLISGSNDDTVVRWAVRSGQPIRTYDFSSDVTSVAYNPRGGTFAAGTQLGELVVRNLTTGNTVRTLGSEAIAHGTQPIRALGYSSGGEILMSGGEDQLAIVWNATTGEALYVFDAHDAPVTGVSLDPNGRTALTASADGSVFWWSITDDAVSQTFDSADGHEDEILAVGYAPDGSSVVTADLDANLLRWSARTGNLLESYADVEGSHTERVTSVAFLPDSQRFVTGSEDTSLVLWNAAEPAAIASFSDAHEDEVTAIAAHPEGNRLLSGDGEGRVVMWDLTLEEAPEVFSDGESEAGHSREIMDIAFNESGTLALTGSADRKVILWNTVTGEPMMTFEHGGRVLGVGFSPDETLVYGGANDDTITAWNAASGEVVSTLNIGLEGQTRYTTAITFNQGNNFALTGNLEGGVQLWNLTEGRAIARYNTNVGGGSNNSNQITALAFRPDGQAAMVGARNQALFEIRTLPLPELIQWTRANRFIPSLSCEERQIFNIPCEGEAIAAEATADPDEAVATETPGA